MKLKALLLITLLCSATTLNAQDLDTNKQKLSYIFGMQIGQGLKMEGLDLEMKALSIGIKDMFDGKEPQIDRATAEKLVADFQQKKQAEIASLAAEKQQASEAFLTKNAKVKGVVVTDSGLQYKVLKQGKGKSPTAKDKVTAHYTGKLIDGTVFDSSVERGEPATFPMTGIIPGWQEALLLMQEGDKWQLVIPATLAYGERGTGQAIGPNETLIFDIELLAIEMADAGEKEPQTD
jgi:FKBP-type peptidyl-prolyl cis-trans isomerase FklB